MLFHIELDKQKFNLNIESLEELMALLEKHQCEDLVISWAESGHLPCLTAVESFVRKYLKDYPTYELIDWLRLGDLTLGEIAHG